VPARSPQSLVLAGVAALLLAMTSTEGTLTMLPGLLLMTAGGLWEALRSRAEAAAAPPLARARPAARRRRTGVNFGRGELRQSRT